MSSTNLMRMGPVFSVPQSARLRIVLKITFFVLLAFALFAFVNDLIAATVADEFQASTNKIQGWIAGNVGKTVSFIALIIGSGLAAFKKDWSTFFGAVVISIGIGVVIGIINSTFGAVLAI